jgi:hypothetical protein
MRSIAAAAIGLALATGLAASKCVAQAGAGARSLTPDETEAYQMSQTLSGSCSPPRQASMSGSESVVRRPEALEGTAAFVQDIQGTFLVLEHYSESLEGHCLVLAWFGGPLAPGHYRIAELADSAMDADLSADTHSFFSMFAIRSSAESSVLVVDSGSVDLTKVDGSNVTGTFEVSGFVVQQSTRVHDATMQGSFAAVAPPEE